MTDVEFNGLIANLGLEHRRTTVEALMRGNDAQCFTTRQYAEMYHRVAHRDDPDHKDGWIKWLETLAPKHLASVGCVEVKAGVWTLESREHDV